MNLCLSSQNSQHQNTTKRSTIAATLAACSLHGAMSFLVAYTQKMVWFNEFSNSLNAQLQLYTITLLIQFE